MSFIKCSKEFTKTCDIWVRCSSPYLGRSLCKCGTLQPKLLQLQGIHTSAWISSWEGCLDLELPLFPLKQLFYLTLFWSLSLCLESTTLDYWASLQLYSLWFPYSHTFANKPSSNYPFLAVPSLSWLITPFSPTSTSVPLQLPPESLSSSPNRQVIHSSGLGLHSLLPWLS